MSPKWSLSRALRYKAAPFLREIDARYPGAAWMGWGRRPLARKAQAMAALMGWSFLALEDGWIRSTGLGEDPQIYSLIVDDLGIYYDATSPSRLEQILQTEDLAGNRTLMEEAAEAMELLKRYRIAKYNHAPILRPYEIKKLLGTSVRDRVLVVAQTAGDASLTFGMVQEGTGEMLRRAREENPSAEIYLKIHPDVLAGKKPSDIDPAQVPRWCQIIDVDCNPYSLLESVDRLYTKTSGMGMEALILGKEVSCSGMPFYAGWGLTQDRIGLERRTRRRTLTELFAAAYLLYPLYRDPHRREACSLRDTIVALAGARK